MFAWEGYPEGLKKLWKIGDLEDIWRLLARYATKEPSAQDDLLPGQAAALLRLMAGWLWKVVPCGVPDVAVHF